MLQSGGPVCSSAVSANASHPRCVTRLWAGRGGFVHSSESDHRLFPAASIWQFTHPIAVMQQIRRRRKCSQQPMAGIQIDGRELAETTLPRRCAACGEPSRWSTPWPGRARRSSGCFKPGGVCARAGSDDRKPGRANCSGRPEGIYLSGWQVAADANLAGQMYPDQSLYPANSVRRWCADQQRPSARRPDRSTPKARDTLDWFAPIVADAEAGFGGVAQCL